MNLSDLPIRINGRTVTVDASWWNDIRLVLLGLFGPSPTGNVQQNLADNTTAVLTGAIFDETEIVDAEINYTLIRGTSRQSGKLRAYYTNQWNLAHEAEESAGVTFSIDTSTGQISYTTDSSSTGKIQWRTISSFAIEV